MMFAGILDFEEIGVVMSHSPGSIAVLLESSSQGLPNVLGSLCSFVNPQLDTFAVFLMLFNHNNVSCSMMFACVIFYAMLGPSFVIRTL
jgi:hypothetical protein